jgi:hypothetical protein
MPVKCGTTTIANILSVDLQHCYTREELNNLNNPEYKKIIIIRKNLIDKFLSGFYEDLFNNSCYDTMDIAFNYYLFFLYKCYKEKRANLNTIEINNVTIPIWFGNCSNVYKNITDKNGNFCSHLQTQKYSIYHIIQYITCKNTFLIELNNLSSILPIDKKCNTKNKLNTLPNDVNILNITLSNMKKNKIIFSEHVLNKTQKDIILDMYKEDVLFINELEKKFNYINTKF